MANLIIFQYLGDMVIVLKNPDHETIDKKSITLKDALLIYEKEIEMGTKVPINYNSNYNLIKRKVKIY